MTEKEYIYPWWDEHGKDPFKDYLENESERRELEQKIQIAINLAINRPSKDPMDPNIPLINLAKDIKSRYKQIPGLLWQFYRVTAIPDPLEMEQQRVKQKAIVNRENRRIEALERLTADERQRYDEQVLESTKSSHSGSWQYHDDDCLCWRYFDNSHCNRGGYAWNCCGATNESSSCYNSTSSTVCVPIPGYVEVVESDEESSLF